MCNITNRATREIAKQHNCDVTWSEMVSSEGLARNYPLHKGGQNSRDENFGGFSNKSLELAKKFSQQESPYWVQIFGNDPKNMAQAAKIIEQEIKPDGIDINLGCPVPKAKKGGYGAIQIKNIPQVIKIIEAIKKEITTPLSLKTRLGLVEPIEILEFAPMLEKAGINQLVVHARTLKGLFSAEPNWKIVKQLNDTLSIPIIYNGGIKTPEDAKFYLEKTGCQNLMVGQAAIGNPWIFQEIKSYLENEATLTQSSEEKKLILLKHAELVVKNYGNEKGLIGFRAQLSTYLRTLQASKKIRKQATQITSISELEKLLNSL
jgi:tRNA-dihydrouridine synthase B